MLKQGPFSKGRIEFREAKHDNKAMSTAKKPTPPASAPRTPDVARMNAALRASGIDYQVEGEKVDAAAFTRAFTKRFPKTMAKLAE